MTTAKLIHEFSTCQKLQYDGDCNFKEGIFANYWTTYSSLTWGLDRMQLSTWYMAINGRGHRVSAKKSKKSRPSAHFLPDPIEGKFKYTKTVAFSLLTMKSGKARPDQTSSPTVRPSLDWILKSALSSRSETKSFYARFTSRRIFGRWIICHVIHVTWNFHSVMF